MKHAMLILTGVLFSLVYTPVYAQDKTVAGTYLKAKIDGAAWEADKFTYDKYPSEIVQVWGDKGTASLRLQLNEPKQGKTDKLIVTDLNSWIDEKFNIYATQSGETQVTKMDDKWIEGTFHFTAKDARTLKVVTVTSGTFRIPNPKSFKE